MPVEVAPRTDGCGPAARGSGGPRGRRREALQGRRRLGQADVDVVQGDSGATGLDSLCSVRLAELGVRYRTLLDAINDDAVVCFFFSLQVR